MRKNYNNQLTELKNELLLMGSLVEEAIMNSIESLKRQDLKLAANVLKSDSIIDDYAMKLEERCVQLIALQQPVACDLRFIIVISKLVTDLERMGDHAKNIAQKVQIIGVEPLLKPLIDIPRMATSVTRRLKESLDAFVNLDAEAAYRIAEEDQEIDAYDEQIFRELLAFMMEDPSTINQATALMFISRFLERIGDHSTNICERIVYMVTGQRVDY